MIPPLLKHHLQLGDQKRIRLCGGPTIDYHTLADLTWWHRHGVSYGVIIDRITTHALLSGFDPVTNKISVKKPTAKN